MALDRTFAWADDPSFEHMLNGLEGEIASLRLVRLPSI